MCTLGTHVISSLALYQPDPMIAGNATIKVVWVDWSVGEFVVIFLE